MHSRITILPVLAFLAGPLAASAADAVKTFPASQCRYTLPGKDWSWVEPVPPHIPADCMAQNGDGVVLAIRIWRLSADVVIDAEFVRLFDPTKGPVPGITKRGEQFTTFKGLPCYECKLHLDGDSSVVRVVLANGFAYQLQLMGDKEPEKRADFEAVMNGFEFTSPPVPHQQKTTAQAPGGGISMFIWYTFPLLFLVAFLCRPGRKKSATP